MTELKPCPFCGGEAAFQLDLAYVHCKNCGMSSERYEQYEDALAAWNTRHTPWQPIETAPKDGSLIHLAMPGGKIKKTKGKGSRYVRASVVVGRWITPGATKQPNKNIIRLVKTHEGFWGTGGGKNPQLIKALSMKPTDWMPLPELPKEKSDE